MNLISNEYRSQNAQLHESRPDYGTTAPKYAAIIAQIADNIGAKTILDYGCGKALLSKALPGVLNYDPAIEEYSTPPEPADLLVSLDVLEHIEPECLDNVLRDMSRLMKRSAFLTVATVPAKKALPDGRNAHLIVEDYKWWLPKLWEHFEVKSFANMGKGFIVTGEPK